MAQVESGMTRYDARAGGRRNDRLLTEQYWIPASQIERLRANEVRR
jgi:hypothetical protein